MEAIFREMEEIYSSKMVVNTYKITWHENPDDYNTK
jgi:hypothetical protein